jgi:hypothetical protein
MVDAAVCRSMSAFHPSRTLARMSAFDPKQTLADGRVNEALLRPPHRRHISSSHSATERQRAPAEPKGHHVSERSGNTKHGQQAATKRARAALENQDDRRARRPLEGATARPATGVATRTVQPVANQPKLDHPTAGEPAVRDQSPDLAALLKRYGITTVPNVIYEWGGYRYSNPSDAIAAAKRGESA